MPTTRTAEALRFEAMAREHLERLGQRIRSRREALGLTQSQVAREMPEAVDSTAVSRWERGMHKPSDDYMEKLAEILQTTPAALAYDETDRSQGTPDLLGSAPTQLDRIERLLQQVASALGVTGESSESVADALDHLASEIASQPEAPEQDGGAQPG